MVEHKLSSMYPKKLNVYFTRITYINWKIKLQKKKEKKKRIVAPLSRNSSFA